MVRKYRRRVLRNLLIAAFLLLLLWREAGYPLPTLEMELHRWERQLLREESEVIWTYDWGAQGGWDMLVGISGSAVTASCGRSRPAFWPRSGDRAVLFPLPEVTRYTAQDTVLFVPGFLAVDLPAGAERARLTLELALGPDPSEPTDWEAYVLEGERQGEAFFFQLSCHHYVDGSGQSDLETQEERAFSQLSASARNGDFPGIPWHLEFFDGAGGLLEEQFSGGIPGNQ